MTRRERSASTIFCTLARLRTTPKKLYRRLASLGILDIPHGKQIATSIVETAREVNDLQLWKGPRQLFAIARSKHLRSNASLESILLKSLQEFSLHPNGIHGVGRENKDEPIAAP